MGCKHRVMDKCKAEKNKDTFCFGKDDCRYYEDENNINPDICSCCKEIWNRENLKNIPLGKHTLHLCPDCYAEYIKPFNEIPSGLETHK